MNEIKTYDIFLFDADNTLFDFDLCEKTAFMKTAKEIGFYADDDVYTRYSEINDGLWHMLEQGKIQKPHLAVSRFVSLFEEFSITASPEETNARYMQNLTDTCILYDDSKKVLERLKSCGKKIYLITNGTTSIQKGRLNISGIKHLLDGVFISDEIGIPKPDKRFIEQVEKVDKAVNKENTLIVGDSLVSDIKLGVNSGYDTCWFNKKHKQNLIGVNPTYEINSLEEVYKFI